MPQTTVQTFRQWLRDEFQPERLLPSLTAGVLIGITEIIVALSVGSLIFSGELAPYLSRGIGITLITTTVVLVIVSLGSSIPGLTGGTQDSPSVILAVIAAALAGASSAGIENRLPTVLAAIAITALLTGAFFLALGFFRLGGLVRFIPYPVVGGFLAGTGWLLVQGSFGVMVDLPLTTSNITALIQPDRLILWVPGLLFALVLFFGLRRIKHFLTMPGLLIGVMALFFLALPVLGLSLDEAMNRGLLLGEVSRAVTWQPLILSDLLAADWAAILGQGGNIAVILVVSAASLLLNASALELTFQQDIDLNRELRVAGLANVLSGLGGGAVSYHALDLSTLCYRTGARSRLPGLVAGAMCAAMLLAGAPLLAFFPKPILGGLLMFMGLGFLAEWVIDGWFRLPRLDYAVVLLILLVIAATNFLIGVGVGLVATIVLFVLSYSRVSVVRHALSGAERRSNVERCAYHRRMLTELGQHTHILELQGFIFFGTANALLERIRARLADEEQLPVRYLILDFRRVTGLDSSAVICFVKGRQLAQAQGITLLLTHVPESFRRQLEQGGLLENGAGVRFFSDLDHGLEWCENQLLETGLVTRIHIPTTLRAQLADGGFNEAHTARLMAFLEPMQVAEGEYLIRQGDEADDLYFIEQGTVSVYLELGDARQMRLRRRSPGTVVGEMGLYMGTRRTASVIVDSPIVAYRLTREALSEMQERQPELAAHFHEFIARLLSERLATTNELLEAVLR